MNIEYAIAAAVGCAICNAVAAILQKIGSGKVTEITSYSPSVLLNLGKQLPYVMGLGLDLVAGVCTLIATNRLPLFLVQAIIASSVVLTAVMEHAFLKHKLQPRTYGSALVVLVGLSTLALASHSEPTAVAGHYLRSGIIGLPVFAAIVGMLAVKFNGKHSAPLLAILSGICFGLVSIVGRLLVYLHPIWLIAKNPLIWSLIVCGTLGVFFFTAALQRTLATITNGIMLAVQTLVPTLVGIIFLGDTPRNGMWLLVWLGCTFAASGCVFMAISG